MPGDFSRPPRIDARKGYFGLYAQQGRVQLDTDWNGQADALTRWITALTADLLGPSGGSAASAGFDIVPGVMADLAAGGARADVQNAAGLDFGPRAAFSVESVVWVRADARGGSIAWCASQTLGSGYELSIDEERAPVFRFQDVVCRAAPLRPDDYVHLIATWDGQRASLFVDGALAATASPRTEPLGPPGPPQIATGGRSRSGAQPRAEPLARSGAAPRPGLSATRSEGPRAQFALGGGTGAFGVGLVWVRVWRGDRAPRRGRLEPSWGEDVGLVGEWQLARADGHTVPDSSGHGRTALLDGAGEPFSPRRSAQDLLIGRGRYYVGGYLAENERTVAFGDQPFVPGGDRAQSCQERGVRLVYLDVWQREVDGNEDPDLLDPALGGLDTTVARQLVWQVKELPPLRPRDRILEELEQAEAEPEAERRLLDHLGDRLYQQWRDLVLWRNEKLRLRARRSLNALGALGNCLYRIQVRSPGGAVWTGSALEELAYTAVVASVEEDEVVTLEDWGALDVGWPVGQLVQVLPTGTGGGQEAATPFLATIVSSDRGSRQVGLDLGGQPTAVEVGDRLRRVATFVWSRSNAVQCYSIEAAAGATAVLRACPTTRLRELSRGDWLSLETERTLLRLEQPGLYRVVDMSADGRTVTLDPPLPADVSAADSRLPLLRLWDQRDEGRGDLIVEAGRWIELESGVEVWFDGCGQLESGDFWTFSSRTATGGVEWPTQDRVPSLEEPAGVHDHLAPLALTWTGRRGIRALDLRRLFTPLADAPGERQSEAFLQLSLRRESPPGYRFADLTLRAERSDPDWRAAPALPPEAGDLGETQAVAVDGRVFLFSELGSVWMLDLQRGRWFPRSPIQPARVRRSGFGVARVANEVHVLGGHDHRGELLADHCVYDTTTDTWTRGADIPEPRAYAGVAATEPFVYLIGGRVHHALEGNRTVATCHVYDARHGRWHPIRPLGQPRCHLSAIALHGRIYAVGGAHEGDVTGRLEVLDPAAADRGWVELTAMPLPRQLAGAAALEGLLHVVGGVTSEAATAAHSGYDPTTDTWYDLAELYGPRFAFGLAEWDGALLAVAGKSADASLLSAETFGLVERLYVHRAEPGPRPAGGPRRAPPGVRRVARWLDADDLLARLAADVSPPGSRPPRRQDPGPERE